MSLRDHLPAPITGHPVETVRKALGIAPRTMRRAVTSGRIKVIVVRQLIPPEEAERVLAQERKYRRKRGLEGASPP